MNAERVLASIALVYLIACVWYLVGTRFLSTPFADSLSQEQRAIKKAEGNKRGMIFGSGLVVGFIALVVWRKCQKPKRF